MMMRRERERRAIQLPNDVSGGLFALMIMSGLPVDRQAKGRDSSYPPSDR